MRQFLRRILGLSPMEWQTYGRLLHTTSAPRGKVIMERRLEEDSEDVENLPDIIKYRRDPRILYSSYIKSQTVLQTFLGNKQLQEKLLAREKRKRKRNAMPLIIEKMVERGDIEQVTERRGEQPERVTFPYAVTDDIQLDEVTTIPLDKEVISTSTVRETIAHRMQAYEEGTLDGGQSDERAHTYNTENEGSEHLVSKFGTADLSVPASKVPCGGCGAHLHCQDPSLPGFLPKELFQGSDKGQLRSMTCQRCYYLKYHKVALNVRVAPDSYPKLLKSIRSERALVMVVVDMLDVPCSIWPGIIDIIGTRRPVVVVGNKVDLLPVDGPQYQVRMKESLRAAVEATDLGRANIKHLALVSARTGYGIEGLITKIQSSWGAKGDVYILGTTNSGKSTLFNALLGSDFCKSSASDLVMRATTSTWPGTTLNMLKFPILRPSGLRMFERVKRLKQQALADQAANQLKPKYTSKTSLATLQGHIGRTFHQQEEPEEVSDPFGVNTTKVPQIGRKILGIDTTHPMYARGKWCYDTPGTVHPDQMLHLLTHEEILRVVPRKLIRPQTFRLDRGQSILLGGLARLDFLYSSENLRVTVFTAEDIPINIVRTVEASAFYRQYLGSPLLGVPWGPQERLDQWPALKPQNLHTAGIYWKESCADVVLSSAGWVSLTSGRGNEIDLRCWTPGGRGIYLRQPSLLPLAVNYRGPRITRSQAYRSHRLYVAK